MRRTEQAQGLRLMKFEEVYGRSCRGVLGQAAAAEILGVSERTFRRWRDRFEADGAEGLYDRRLGRVSAAPWSAGAGASGAALASPAIAAPLLEGSQRDEHDAHGVADHVGWALLSLRPLGHHTIPLYSSRREDVVANVA